MKKPISVQFFPMRWTMADEHCMEFAEPLREVRLNARTGKGILTVNISNAYNNTARRNFITEKEHLPKTTKKDAKNHGLGLRSIQETAEKYGGNMEIKQTDEIFNLFLYLPIPNAAPDDDSLAANSK